MALNFEHTYEIADIRDDYRLMHFNTEVKGEPFRLRAFIDNEQHFLMPDVFNLSFGPPGPASETRIDDSVVVNHDDMDKMMSTILLFVSVYLSSNPTHFIGIDGSCDRRALLYFRKIRENNRMLTELFTIISGVKYYIRLKRFSKPDSSLSHDEQLEAIRVSLRENLDLADMVPIPETITAKTTIRGSDYNFNYFIFKI